jgi:hypothetical protein
MHLTAHSYPITERGSASMNTHDDDLRVRLGRIRNRGSHYKSFFAVVYGGVPDIDPGKHRLLIHGLDQIRGRGG